MIVPVAISDRFIGPEKPCFVIAEAGVNHNGDIDLARRLVDAALAAGADAVKFQSFKANKLASEKTPKAEYQKKTTDSNESQYDMLQRLEMNDQMHIRLIEHCKQAGIVFLSSPFEEESADFLCSLGVPALKIPSGEITNFPFLKHVSGLGKPLILSTGMSYLGEVEAAVQTIAQFGNPGLVLLHCLSNYPADPAECNLKSMKTLTKAFKLPVGYSDHVLSNEVALAAVALGATVIEKHFTLDRTMPGPDHKASLEPAELASLIKGIRTIESALGDGRKQPAPSEESNRKLARKSLVTAQELRAGTTLTREMVLSRRPSTGLSPKNIEKVIGAKLLVDLPKDIPLSWEVLQLIQEKGVDG